MKKYFAFIIFAIGAIVALSSCASTESDKATGNSRPEMRVGVKGDRKVNVETDPYIVSVIDEGKSKFAQMTFTDGETGTSVEYSLFVPANLDTSKQYPLIMYIADASSASKTAKEIVEQYFGANIWVSQAEQDKHECFVLVPSFSVLAVDDFWNTSDEVEALPALLNNLVQNYNIDVNRIYTTGQSMGCMISLYLNSKYPDLFAASLFVSGKWDISVLSPLEHAKFFFVAAEGDPGATGSQNELLELFDKDNVPYTFGMWSAKESSEVQNQNANALIAEGKNANFIRFEKGSVLSGDETFEHNASFNYGYRIEAVRDWIFEQKK